MRIAAHLPPSLAAAHIPKMSLDPQAEIKAFGSAFFHNYARLTFSVKKQVGASVDLVTVLVTPQKQNDGERLSPVALEFNFALAHIAVRQVDPQSVESFAASLPLNARLRHLLKGGPMTTVAMAAQLDAKLDSVCKAIKRGAGEHFIYIPGDPGAHGDARVERWALLERWAS